MNLALSKHQQQALDEFAFRAAVPLFCSKGESADHLATGIFIGTATGLFLVTARHILETCDAKDIAIAASPEGSALQTLGNLVVHSPVDLPDTDIDILALELRDEGTQAIARKGWRVLEPSNGDEPVGTGELVLIGYASETLKLEGINLKGRPTGIITAPLAAFPEDANPPPNPALDLFLQLPREALIAGGDTVVIPRIQGMSGCAIWEFREVPDTELWSPDRALRLVGIQSSAKRGHYLRGKRWLFVERMLARASAPTAPA